MPAFLPPEGIEPIIDRLKAGGPSVERRGRVDEVGIEPTGVPKETGFTVRGHTITAARP